MAAEKRFQRVLPSLGWLMAFAGVALVGCGGKPDSPGQPLTVDKSVLKALEPYDPVYKLSSSGRVVALRLEGERIPASVVDEVSKLTELTEELSLYAASITDESLAKLHTLKKVERLGLGYTPITQKGLVHLEALSSLRWLWLTRDLTTTPEAEKLKETFPHLTVYAQ